MFKWVLLSIFSFALPLFALEVGDTGPCVVLRDLQPNGDEIEQCVRTPHKKGQFVVIDFFHPQCDDCLVNLEALNGLTGDTATTTTVRLVGSDKNEERLLKFIADQKKSINMPVSLDTEIRAMKAYGVNAVPTVFVLNSRHKILYKHIGALGPTEIEKIKKVVKP